MTWKGEILCDQRTRLDACAANAQRCEVQPELVGHCVKRRRRELEQSGQSSPFLRRLGACVNERSQFEKPNSPQAWETTSFRLHHRSCIPQSQPGTKSRASLVLRCLPRSWEVKEPQEPSAKAEDKAKSEPKVKSGRVHRGPGVLRVFSSVYSTPR